MTLPNERTSRYAQREREQFHQGRDVEPCDERNASGNVADVIRENPGYALLATFLTGLGAGLLLTALTGRKRRNLLTVPEHLGANAREAIQHAVARFVPEAVTRFLSKQS